VPSIFARLPALALFALVALGAAEVAAQSRTTYVVQAGDILGSIAERHGVSVAELREWNDLDGDMIRVGQELVLQRSATRGAGGSSYRTYTVRDGDTLGGIAARHDVTVADIVGWNRGLDPDRIRAGQELRILQYGRAERRVVYEVQNGDFLGRIAARHDVSVDDICRWNGNMDPDRVRVGQDLVLWVAMPEVASESVGRANDGRLVNGEALPLHRAYAIRNPDRAWGTNETISLILEGFDAMYEADDDLPRVAVHDLSLREGGEIGDHRSHESGRDADIGYYHAGCRRDCEYRAIGPDELDVERQWALFRHWIERDEVEYIFVDYALQERLYGWLEENGARRTDLQRWFQYPRGRDSAVGLIRHERNHADHFHVRFACPEDDRGCR
jgi:LysM repeat protein